MHHYIESGLQNVWLANGYRKRKVAGGHAVAIADADGLHRAIGRAIAQKSSMTGAEFRFLRKELALSQVRFGQLVGASEEAVSLWERRGRVPKSACLLMQALYLETIDGNVQVRELIERLADLDRQHRDRMVFEDVGGDWREAA